MQQRVAPLALVLAFGLLAGCAVAPFRAHPQFEERSRGIKAVALLPPDVKVYRLTAGGVRELMDEWSEEGRQNLVTAIAKRVGGEGRFVVKELDPDQSPAIKQPVTIAGKSGFRLMYTWKTKEGLALKGLHYGFQDGKWVYRVIYQAAARYYFDRDLQIFERVLGTFRLLTKSA